MAFIETPRFPDDLRYGFAGGPEFSTEIVVLGSGYEQRNQNWVNARGRWQGTHGPHDRADTDTLIAFFRAMGGAAHGFRMKDWTDYQVDLSTGTLGTGVGTGLPTYQLTKNYVTGAASEARPIKKPVAATVEVYRNAVKLTSGYSLDAATGIVTFAADVTKSIDANSVKTVTGLTQANPGVVTATAHGFSTGDKIKLASVGGMTQVNNLYFTITVTDPDHFSLGVDTSAYTAYTTGGTATRYGITQTSPARVYAAAHGFSNGQVIYLDSVGGMTEVTGRAFTVANAAAGYFDLSGENAGAYAAYTSGGQVKRFPQAGDALTWLGEFDVPVRFVGDRLAISQDHPGLYSWDSVELVEIRV